VTAYLQKYTKYSYYSYIQALMNWGRQWIQKFSLKNMGEMFLLQTWLVSYFLPHWDLIFTLLQLFSIY